MFLKYGKNLSICIIAIVLCCSSIISVAASDVTTESVSTESSSNGYVTIEVPLTWTLNCRVNHETGEDLYDTDTSSVSNYINIIEGASYSVSIASPGAGYNSGCIAFYYNDAAYIWFQELWAVATGSRVVSLNLPSNTTRFRLASDLLASADTVQNTVNLSITLSATYLEEHNLTEETLLDLVYKDDSSVIDDAANRLTSERSELEEQEDYLMTESTDAFNKWLTSFSFDDLSEYFKGFAFVGSWFNNMYTSHAALKTSISVGSALVLMFILVKFRGH